MKKNVRNITFKNLMTLALTVISLPFYLVYWIVDENHKKIKFS